MSGSIEHDAASIVALFAAVSLEHEGSGLNERLKLGDSVESKKGVKAYFDV